MLQIQVGLQQICLQLSIPKTNPISLSFYVTHNHKPQQKIAFQVPFNENYQKISFFHSIYTKYQEFSSNILKYVVILNQTNSQDKKTRRKKAGICEIDFRSIKIDQVKLPIKVSKKAKLTECPDKQSYLNLTFKIRPIQQYIKLPSLPFPSNVVSNFFPDPIYQQLEQFQKQLQRQSESIEEMSDLSEKTMKMKQLLDKTEKKNRNLQQQIQEVAELNRTKNFMLDNKLNDSKKKTQRDEIQYRKIKEKVARLVNLINQYGDQNLVQKVGVVLTGRGFSSESSKKQSKNWQQLAGSDEEQQSKISEK